MTHDDSTRSQGPRYTAPGLGVNQLFRCGKCDKSRQMLGRRLRSVLGVRTWICGGCVPKVGS